MKKKKSEIFGQEHDYVLLILATSRPSASVIGKRGICEAWFGVFSFKSCISQLSVDQISRNLVHF